MFVLTIASAAVLAYGVYVTAFYTLVTVCIFLGGMLSRRYKMVKRATYANSLGNHYLTDLKFKNHISLYCSLTLNLLYAGINAVSAFFYLSFGLVRESRRILYDFGGDVLFTGAVLGQGQSL